jgi:hypothetical protein
VEIAVNLGVDPRHADQQVRVVEHWSLERLARRHLEIYRNLLSEKR